MMARALDANGAKRVYIVGRRLESLQKVASTGKSGTIVPIVGDVTSKDSLASVAKQISSEVDHIDVVIANSGIAGPPAAPNNVPGQTRSSALSLEELQEYLWNVPMEEFSNVSNINVTGVFYTALAFLPLLQAANKLRPVPSDYPRPQIITTGSIGGFNRMPLAGYAYGASKAAVHHLTKQMATMWGKYDIRANAIAPGLYWTELSAPLFEKMGIGQGLQEGSFSREAIPQTRAGSEQDMAALILFLCSRAGSYISGSVLVTDGGRLSVHPATY